MLANTNILYLSKNEEKKDELDFGWKVKDLDKSNTDFSVESASAEKLKGEVSNLYVFDKYRETFQVYVDHIKATMEHWDGNLKTFIITSANRLRSFCSTYTTYYNELYTQLNKNPDSNKTKILSYLDEIKRDTKSATESIDVTQKHIKTYVDLLEEDKENLNVKVIPKLTNLYKSENIKLGALEKDIANSEIKLAGLEKQYLTAVFGAGAAGAGLTLTIIVSATKKGAGKFGTKIGGRLLTRITEKLGSRAVSMIGKGLAVITIVTTLTEIAGLATSLYYIVDLNKKISQENTNLTKLKLQQMQLNTDVANLNSMNNIFTKVTGETGDTYNKFSSFKDKWVDITSEFDIMEEKLQTVDSKAKEKKVMYIRSALANMNAQFLSLMTKLKNNGMGLNLTINEEVKFTDREASNTTQTIFTPSIKIPTRLYSSYNNLLYI
ncbi:MAG: hypothetical protein O7C59_05990 [Rickettsia endosymbiont of Ixodes persulcatus]|nr:hypothetical protein [Rickettsia endosymbiont of Ixodes persulcatus]